ncbi:MAG TPA: hypothetical protein P5048_00530 [Chlamydiales bacterium]|nr:hypothetical protein [Chlamydiales bacterium]
MKRLSYLTILLLCSCSGINNSMTSCVDTVSQKTSQIKLAYFQNRLDNATKKLQSAEQKRITAMVKLSQEKLTFISKKINEFERFISKKDPTSLREELQGCDVSSLFFEEREELSDMMKYDDVRFDAQEMLDKILSMITSLNDQKNYRR